MSGACRRRSGWLRSLLPSADNPKGGTMERGELIEDPDVRGFCALGTVDAGGTIRISIA